MSTDPILSVRNLSTGYGGRQVLFDVSLDVLPGEVLLVTGGNGSGKSTLLKAIFGLILPWNSDARIEFRPDDSSPAVRTDVPRLNLVHGLAYLPQKNGLFDDLTVDDNLQLAGHILEGNEDFAQRRREALDAIPQVRSLAARFPERLSGGERQLTLLAMTLLHRPRLLLMDEPLAGVDSRNVRIIVNALGELLGRSRPAIIIVEHRLSEVAPLVNRSIHLRLGTLG